MTLQRFQGAVVVVTGAGAGIGRATALAFAAEGASVVLAERDAISGERVAGEIGARGGRAVVIRTDVSLEGSVAALFERVQLEFGRVDVLVNNAGVFPRIAWDDLTLEDWDRTHGVNLRGAFLCCQAAVPLMRAGGGAIVNLSSVTLSLGVHTHLTHYIASKGGVIGLTRALARELGAHNIRVNAVAPGAVQTESEAGTVTPRDEALVLAGQALQFRVQPEDIANAILFLASSEARCITGQSLLVDNGWAME